MPELVRVRTIGILIGALLLAAGVGLAQSGDWPDPYAYWVVKPSKVAGMEMTDPHWAHLHHGEPAATSVTFEIGTYRGVETFTSYLQAQFRVRYTVKGIPVSPWLDTPPFTFTLQHDAPEIAHLPSGIYDLSVEAEALPSMSPSPEDARRAPGLHNFAPYPMFLHLGGRVTRTTMVPLLAQNAGDLLVESTQPHGAYLDAAALVPKGYPIDAHVTPWHVAPSQADLWQESLQPHSEQFLGAQMLWEEPPGTVDAGLRFVRAFAPKHGESFRGLWNGESSAVFVAPHEFGFSGHRSFPVIDGPRGIGWTNGYVQGVVDADGRLWMVNVSGQLRVMHPNGELVTVVGWRVKPGKAPIWYLKPLTAIRQNMEFRGTFVNGGWPDPLDPGWHQPMDVALDPNNPNRVYVTGFYDHAIYQVDVDRTTWTGTVSVLAGDPNHAAGYLDGVGTAARFNGPLSLVASLDGRSLFVTDHDNDAVREIDLLTTAVNTIFGGPAQSPGPRLQGQPGISCGQQGPRLGCGPQNLVSQHVTLDGQNPTIYFPFWIRLASTGELVLFDQGMNTVRALNVTARTARVIDQISPMALGTWTWGDVDRWGATGPVDGIYWGTAVSIGPIPSGEAEDRFNENYRYTSFDGTLKQWVFGTSMGWKPTGAGPGQWTRGPHYPWLMAVDPRGAVILGGIGDHGLTRLRLRKPTDPDVTNWISSLAFRDAAAVWQRGSRGDYHYTVPVRDHVTPANPLHLTYGWEASNYLGLPTAWAVGPETTDTEIDALFQWPEPVASDPDGLSLTRSYVRLYRGSGGEVVIPDPDQDQNRLRSPR